MGDGERKRGKRTRRDIKKALTELLSKKALDDITMSELAREAEVSRSTLYQHYANVHEAYVDTVLDFDQITAPVMTQLECYEGIESPGTFPFCTPEPPYKQHSMPSIGKLGVYSCQHCCDVSGRPGHRRPAD